MEFLDRVGGLDPGTVDDPTILLRQAWALEPELRLTERTALLNRLQQVLKSAHLPPQPEGRQWSLELKAERALDAVRVNDLQQATDLSDEVIAQATSPLALARAWDARGRILAWTGTEAATRRADLVLTQATERYLAMGAHQWAGYLTFWRANSVYLQNGDLPRADELMREALTQLGTDSPWSATVLTFHADVLMARGNWTETERTLATAAQLSDRDNNAKTRAYVTWSRARLASARGDAMATERYIRETERERGDWFAMNTGITFLADSAELLDRVGLPEQARKYLDRALERDPTDEFVRQAQAALLARRGEPIEAIDALQDLTRGDWLEKRWLWRHTLLAAWATFRAGREGAGELAVRAFEQAAASGGIDIALHGEPEIASALLALAEAAGSSDARAQLLGENVLLVRLLGPTRVVHLDGTAVALPPGKLGELVRLLAVHRQGMSVEQVATWFFPDVALSSGRQRLRQMLTRLRTVVGPIVVRAEDRLQLVPAWVDVREFLAAADRVRSARRAHAPQRAYAALALWGGPPMAADMYAPWSHDIREQLDHRYLMLLDLITADASDHGSHQEAATAITAALHQAPHERDRYYKLAEHLTQLGRHVTAQHLARLADIDLDATQG